MIVSSLLKEFIYKRNIKVINHDTHVVIFFVFDVIFSSFIDECGGGQSNDKNEIKIC